MTGFQKKILGILRSPQFFAAILILFFIEAAWIAISAAYPMVFDENMHFTLIQAYAHQLSPFWPAHSVATDPAGAVVRDPSYLYHYLMSFPYRLISAVTSDQMMQVVDLRFINIFLFGGSLIFFRKLLLKTKVSPAIIHACLLFFVLTPVVPLLAGQINYDNLIMLVTASSLLLAVTISQTLNHGHRLPIARIFWLFSLCLLGSLVQFEYLPIVTAITLWLGWQIWRLVRSNKLQFTSAITHGWQTASWQRKLAVIVPFAVALGLWGQMYGVNIIQYHALTPSCSQVLTRQECVSSGSWERAQQALMHKGYVDKDPVAYAISWTYRMLVAMFFTSSGGASPSANYLSVNPLPLIFVAALGVCITGALLIIKYRWKVFAGYEYLGFLFFASVVYSGSLLLHNYFDYVHLGQKYAIQGRYLFPIALPCMIIIALAFRKLLDNRANAKLALLLGVFLLFLQGGGALTYITYSRPNWYWQNDVSVSINRAAQAIIKPLILMKTPVRNVGLLN